MDQRGNCWCMMRSVKCSSSHAVCATFPETSGDWSSPPALLLAEHKQGLFGSISNFSFQGSINFPLVPLMPCTMCASSIRPSPQTPGVSLNNSHLQNLMIVSALHLPSPVLQGTEISNTNSHVHLIWIVIYHL